MDPEFMRVLAGISSMLRGVFGTSNELTLALSGTGFAGMEAALTNVLEPGDTIAVCVSGFFGGRAAEMAARLGARPVVVTNGFGSPVAPQDLERTLEREGGVKAVFLVAGETSVGLNQPVAPLSAVAAGYGALVICDFVTVIGGARLNVDEWGVDVAYGGSQKCLGAPPGAAPITVSPAAREAIASRKSPVPSWYLDLESLQRYWSYEPFYHHTCPSPIMLALHEALRLVGEETLPARADRHDLHGRALVAGLEAIGLRLASHPDHRLSMLTPVWIPEGENDLRVRRELLRRFDIEIGGGLGEWAGRVWRIGMMGESSTRANVLLVMSALEELLGGRSTGRAGDALAAALEVLRSQPAVAAPL